MPREKFMPIKDAARAAGVDEDTLRQELEHGVLKGEKRRGWLWDEWYVDFSEMDQLKVRRKNRIKRESREQASSQSAVEKLKQASSLPTMALATLLEPVGTASDPDDAVPGANSNWRREYKEVVKRVAEEIMRPLLERLELQAAALREKDAFIEEQAQQLRLLPDLEKRDEEHRLALENKENEARALQTRLEEEEAGKLAAQEQFELSRIEREAERLELEARLHAMQQEIEELRRPWWKRLFAPLPTAGS